MTIPHNRIVLLLRVMAIALGAANAGAAMAAQSMGHEGVNYLDQADAWFRGDWSTAVNGTWSPLYPLLLGIAMRVIRPSASMEFPLVHAVNFVLYILALFAFEFFWKQVSDRYYARDDGDDVLPRWALTSLGYALFVWTSLCVIRLFVVAPDMLVAALVFLASGWLLCLTSGRMTARTTVLLGATLGAMCLAKAFTFPVAILALLVAGLLFVRIGQRGRVLAAAAGFAIVTVPFVVALSRDAGRVTLGDVFRVTYLKYVLNAPFPHYRDGSPDIDGTPEHPMDGSATTPPVIQYDAGMPVTYAPLYDQGYWFAGLSQTFRPGLQWRATATNLERYTGLFLRLEGLVLAWLVALVIFRGRRKVAMESWVLGGIAVAAFATYSVVYVEDRYVAPFIVLLWAAALLFVKLPAAPHHPAWLRASSVVMLAGFAFNIGVFHLDGLNALIGFAPSAVGGPVSANDTGPDRPTDVALATGELGLSPGDRIGIIGDALHASWARLARFRIVAAVAPADAAAFWRGSSDDRAAVLRVFEAMQVRAVFAVNPPADSPLSGWTRLGDTHVYVHVSTRALPATR